MNEKMKQTPDILLIYFALVKANVPIKCVFCHEPIFLEEDELVDKNGIFHIQCHKQAFPEHHVQKMVKFDGKGSSTPSEKQVQKQWEAVAVPFFVLHPPKSEE